MGYRGLRGIRILIFLICIFFIGGCSKMDSLPKPNRSQTPKGTSDELITQDSNKIIDEEVLFKEDSNMSNEEVDVTKKEPIDTYTYKKTNEADNSRPQILSVEEISKQLRAYPAGSVINTSEYSQEVLDSLFLVNDLSQEIIDRIYGKSYKEDADIPYSDLRYIRVLHMGFDGLTHIGEMIVNKAIAQDVVDIFYDLYNLSYPIEKMLLIDDYDADDLKSMADNNSSAFNYRLIEGTNRRSVHSYGLAIDINPLYNPYVRTRDGKMEVLPENAIEYVDRSLDNIYYITKDDSCYEAFISRGFTWGGEWKNSKDYQHFEKKLTEE